METSDLTARAIELWEAQRARDDEHHEHALAKEALAELDASYDDLDRIAQNLLRARHEFLGIASHPQRIGANDGPPKVVGIVPLSADTNVFSVLQECLREASWSDRKSDATGSHHLVNALYLKYKARCSYVVAEATLASALDVARVADILVLVVDGGSAQEFVIDQVSLLDMFCTKVFLL